MLDIVKYSPLDFRTHQGQCVPRGPVFERAKTSRFHFPECTVEFRAPRHSPLRRLGIEQYMAVPEKLNNLQEASDFGGDLVPSNSWRKIRLCFRNWAFYGPWFTGYQGDVGFSMNLVELADKQTNVNFLYPNALETAIQGFVTAYHGHKIFDKDKLTPYFNGPVNWAPINDLPVPGVQFDLEDTHKHVVRCRYVFLPVSLQHLMVIRFRYLQNCAGKREEKNAQISPEPMLDLIKNVTSSIRLTPSPAFQAEINKAKEDTSGEYAVSSECQPFKWPADVAKDGLTILDYRADRYER